MYIKLIRNEPQGSAITGRLVINGRWFCNTLERVGYQIPPLCYHVAVTMSPKFKRLLPLVTGVPRLPIGGTPSNSEASNRAKPVQYPAAECRTGIRFHRGTKPQHSTGCILVVEDNKDNIINKDNSNNLCARPTLALAKGEQKLSSLPLSDVLISLRSNNRVAYGEAEMLSMLSLEKTETLSSRHIPVGSRSAADVETQLTRLLLQAQNEHEEIILEVTDFRPGTEYGYNTMCPSSECAREKEIRSANFARRHSYLAGARTIVSSSILEPTRLSDGC